MDTSAKYIKTGLLKTLIMFLITFGLYPFYWFYKQWNSLKISDGFYAKISPFWRALFYPVYCFPFAKKLKSDFLASGAVEESKARKFAPMLSFIPIFILVYFLITTAAAVLGIKVSTWYLGIIFIVFFCVMQDTINKIMPSQMPKEKPVTLGDVFIVSFGLLMVLSIVIGGVFYFTAKAKGARECLIQQSVITRDGEFSNACLGIKGNLPSAGGYDLMSTGERLIEINDGAGSKFFIATHGATHKNVPLKETARRVLSGFEYSGGYINPNADGKDILCFNVKENILSTVCVFNHNGISMSVSATDGARNTASLTRFLSAMQFK